MDIRERLDTLEAAHRALLAQHTALMTICQIILPIVPCDRSILQRLTKAAYEGCAKEMDALGHDAEHQENVLDWIEKLSSILLSGQIPSRHIQNTTRPRLIKRMPGRKEWQS